MPQPVVATSHTTADPETGEASLMMAYADASLSLSMSGDIVAVPERGEVTTTLDGLRFIVAESVYWTSIVDRRIHPGADRRYISLPSEFPLTVGYSWQGNTRRVDSASLDTVVYSINGEPTGVGLAYVRGQDEVTFAARPASRLLWTDWQRFLALHQEFFHICTTGERNGYDRG